MVTRQQALIEQLQARVAELEEQLKRLSKPPKDCTNSSIPPSKSPKANRSNQDSKRGPKRGHQGHGRKRQLPDMTVECRPHRCARCGADLTDVPAKLLGTNQSGGRASPEPAVDHRSATLPGHLSGLRSPAGG